MSTDTSEILFPTSVGVGIPLPVFVLGVVVVHIFPFHFLEPLLKSVGRLSLTSPVLFDLLPFQELVLVRHYVILSHTNREALVQPAFLAEATRHRRDLALLVEGAPEVLLCERVASKERLAALACYGIEIVAQRLVTAYSAYFTGVVLPLHVGTERVSQEVVEHC